MKNERIKLEVSLIIIGLCLLILHIFTVIQQDNYELKEKISRGFYDENAVYLHIDNGMPEDYQYIKGLAEEGLTVSRRIGINIKGVYTKEKSFIPMKKGKAYDLSEMHEGVLVGNTYNDSIYNEGTKRYIDFAVGKLEVLGVIGIDQDSLLDYMTYHQLDDAVRYYGMNGSWVIEGASKNEIVNNIEAIRKNVIADIKYIDVSEVSLGSIQDIGVLKLISIAMYLIMGIAIVLLTVQWIKTYRREFLLWKVLGVEKRILIKIMLQRYCLRVTPLLTVILIFYIVRRG